MITNLNLFPVVFGQCVSYQSSQKAALRLVFGISVRIRCCRGQRCNAPKKLQKKLLRFMNRTENETKNDKTRLMFNKFYSDTDADAADSDAEEFGVGENSVDSGDEVILVRTRDESGQLVAPAEQRMKMKDNCLCNRGAVAGSNPAPAQLLSFLVTLLIGQLQYFKL